MVFLKYDLRQHQRTRLQKSTHTHQLHHLIKMNFHTNHLSSHQSLSYYIHNNIFSVYMKKFLKKDKGKLKSYILFSLFLLKRYQQHHNVNNKSLISISNSIIPKTNWIFRYFDHKLLISFLFLDQFQKKRKKKCLSDIVSYCLLYAQ